METMGRGILSLLFFVAIGFGYLLSRELEATVTLRGKTERDSEMQEKCWNLISGLLVSVMIDVAAEV